MFKYQVRGIANDRKPMIIALTHFADVAQYIVDHAAEALDPDGTLNMKVTIVERAEADKFAYRPRGTREE